MAEAVRICRLRNLGLLVVDTFASWSRMGGDSENNSGVVLEALEPIAAAAAQDLAVFAIHHDRKGCGHYGDGLRGSNALAGAVDVVTGLTRLDGTPEGRVLRAVSRYDDTPAELALALSDDGYTALGDVASARADVDRERVYEAIQVLRAASPKELGDHVDMTERTARRLAEELYERNRVYRAGAGVKGDPRVYSIDSGSPDPLVPEQIGLVEAVMP